MPLPLSEIRAKAIAFAAEWKDASSECAEAQSFWNDFFAVFGIKRRSVASFEEKVRNLGKGFDRIDVHYSGVMIGEHKSRGEDLTAAASQAFDYIQSLTREGRHNEIPKFIVVSDFARFAVYDLDSTDPTKPVADFKTAKLHENIKHLGFLSGYSAKPVDPEDPINIQAVEILGNLHDALEKGGYSGHRLERFLVRVLFCLFAEDTGLFDPDAFKSMVQQTRADGSDLGPMLARLFDVLNTDKPKRPRSLPDELKDLPYVNGELFAENLGFADFTAPMRDALLACCNLYWASISPAVFGSLFQSIHSGLEGKKRRRQLGEHYTSERDILKLVRSLFLDDLKAELDSAGKDRKKLQAFQDKLASLRFLDPACGCGNFLVVTYRELRALEIEAVSRLHGPKAVESVLNIDALFKVNVDQMCGIEIEEWPARIAEVAMWLIDHQMNLAVSERFGKPLQRLPLTKSAKIAVANALRVDWNDVLPAKKCSFVLGNPPFVGKKERVPAQKADLDEVAKGLKGAGVLDYVAGWYLLAARYIRGSTIRCAFVSTNSITQGEQVGVLWPELFRRRIKIHFGHRTFQWMSEARGKANVHVVIVGFGAFDRAGKTIYDYPEIDGDPIPSPASNISPYLIVGPDMACVSRSRPLCDVPEIMEGSALIDDGHLLIADEDVNAFRRENPEAAAWIRPFSGGDDLINGNRRWCLWLAGVPASDLRASPRVMERVAAVKVFRESSGRAATLELAKTPALFGEVRQPKSAYLFIPKTSSERRAYIPTAFAPPELVINNTSLFIEGAKPYHFGVLSSEMHMAWVRQVCGRLESRYRYSNKLVYNNFPWPQEATPKQKAAVESAAQAVLDARSSFKGQTLADLYDPLAMPKLLRDAHKDLDRAVDKCYRPAPFDSERARVEYLFTLYQRLTAPLMTSARKRRGSPAP